MGAGMVWANEISNIEVEGKVWAMKAVLGLETGGEIVLDKFCWISDNIVKIKLTA